MASSDNQLATAKLVVLWAFDRGEDGELVPAWEAREMPDEEIAVPARVLDEFRDLYPSEAAEIEPRIAVKISLRKTAYTVKAAAIAEKLNSGFSRGQYDRNADLYAASIVSVEKVTIVTTGSQLATYLKMGCKAIELSEWASQ